MARLRDSSELKEAAALLGAIIQDTREASRSATRGDRLRQTLERLCARAHLRGAAVADAHGLPLASHDFPYSVDAIGALASVMGEAMAKVQSVTRDGEAVSVAIDIGFADKLVARRFGSEDETYFILAVCPQDLDERGELELSIEEIRSVVARGGES